MKDNPSLVHRLEYALLRTVVFAAGLLPLRTALAAGALFGRLAWSLFRVRRGTAMINLRQAFPERDAGELRRIGLCSYMNNGRFMMEFARQDRMNVSCLERHVSFPSPERLRAVRELKGALTVTGHFGNWELLGIALAHALGDMAFLVGRQSNSLVDGYINRMRSVHGIELYNRRTAVKGVLRSVKRGGYVCWLSDQDAGDSGIVVDFFGFPASTPRGAAAFSVKLGVPVVPAFMVRNGRGPDHALVLGEPVTPVSGIPREEAERLVTEGYTGQLERMVKERPELYWWSHRRWKSTGLYTAAGAGNREGQKI